MSTSGGRRKHAARYATFAAASLTVLCLFLFAGSAQCQAPEGDESFEFHHQDIGRISGLSSGTSQVAPQTTIVARQQPAPPAREAAVSAHHHEAGQSRHSQRHNGAGSQRKSNRVTLVARRDPVVSQAVTVAAVQPATAQLPAPPQQYAPQLQTVPSSSFELARPTFAPQPPQEPVVSGGQSLPAPSSSALSSFRAAGSSVSPRHSALIAQVASERAATAGLVSAHSEPAQPALPAHTFQPLAPTHNEPAQSQPQSAFASFAASQSVPLAATPSFQSLAHHQGQQQQQHHQHQHHQQQPQLVSSPSQPQLAVNQAEEPLVAPSFEHVLGHGCPHKGVFSWENKDHCDRYYMCTNGTFTEEACPNGLAYSQLGAVYQHCAYNWNVQCGNKKTAQPIASPGCPWQFGIFPIVANGRCSIDYFVCEWGVPETKRCTPEGLFYDDRIKGCQWADQLGCKSEALLNFKCPPEDEDNPYWPYPRYYHNTQDVIVCVNEQPRLVHCNEDQLVDSSSLACLDVNKKKKRPF